MNSGAWPLIVLAASSCVWGLAWIPLKALGAHGLGGVTLSFVASCAAGACLLPRLLAERAHWRDDIPSLGVIALLGGYANLSFTVAAMHGDIVRVLVLFYLLPAWSALGGRWLLGERLDAVRIGAVVLALVGAWTTLGGIDVLRGGLHWTDALAISCGLAFAGNNLMFRARQELPVGSKTAAMVLGGAVLAGTLLAAGMQGGSTTSPATLVGAVGYGLGWLLIANLCTQYGVTHLEAARASIIILLELVLAVGSAVLIGGERMSGAELVGGLMILGAAVIEARRAG